MTPLKIVTIYRLPETEDGTFGMVWDETSPFALSLERKWLYNRNDESCIPLGEYNCQKVNSPHFGWTFEVQSVPNRTEILFHKGNTVIDTHGCILLGKSLGEIANKSAILDSGTAFTEFMSRMNGLDNFKLVIQKV